MDGGKLRVSDNKSSKIENPMQTDGFEFIEYTAFEKGKLEKLFLQMGFEAVSKHRSKDVTLFRQGNINFIVNQEKESYSQAFGKIHGPSACAMGFRVKDAAYAYERAVALGAHAAENLVGPMELNIPAIEGIGGSLIFLVDRYENGSIYEVDFVSQTENRNPKGVGLKLIDHVTHNVHRGRMDKWAHFYEKLFNFREIRYFDIDGKKTGLTSRALSSPCDKIKIPLNESKDDSSQIEEFLKVYKGEGIQHIALTTEDIYQTVDELQERGIKFMDVPDTYYEKVDERLPGHGEDLDKMRQYRIIIDGSLDPKTGKADTLLLQIFTDTVIGPIFFEIIQRKKNEGFGEGNFKALFESIELDQIKRGVIKE